MQSDDRPDDEIEQLLIRRWLYRGGILALIAAFAILLTMLASRGFESLPDQVAAGLLVVCGIAAAAVFLVTRQQDIAKLRALRKRRGTGPGPTRAATTGEAWRSQ